MRVQTVMAGVLLLVTGAAGAAEGADCRAKDAKVNPGEVVVAVDRSFAAVIEPEPWPDEEAAKRGDYVLRGVVCDAATRKALSAVDLALTPIEYQGEGAAPWSRAPGLKVDDLAAPDAHGYRLGQRRPTTLSSDGGLRFGGLKPSAYALALDWTRVPGDCEQVIFDLHWEQRYPGESAIPADRPYDRR